MSDEYLDDMMNQAPGAINFTMFLTLFGERLQGTDPEDVIRNAFGCFDEANAGTYFIRFFKAGFHKMFLKYVQKEFLLQKVVKN